MKRPTNRNSQGWLIPRKGTLSRAIYNLLLKNQPAAQIAKTLKHDRNATHVLIHDIKNPEKKNERRKAWYNNNKASVARSNAKWAAKQSPYVMKLKAAGYTVAEARAMEAKLKVKTK